MREADKLSRYDIGNLDKFWTCLYCGSVVGDWKNPLCKKCQNDPIVTEWRSKKNARS